MASKELKLVLKVDSKSGQASVERMADSMKGLETGTIAGTTAMAGMAAGVGAAGGVLAAFGDTSKKATTAMERVHTTLSKVKKEQQLMAASTSKSIQILKKLTQGYEKASKAVKDYGRNHNKMLKVVGAAAAYATYKFLKFTKSSIVMAARFETLGVVMRIVGKNAGYSTYEMNKFDLALRKTGITMTESRRSLARMAQVQLDLNKATELGRIAQDAAVIANINSSEAFERLIYGIQSANVRVLRTLGINVVFERSYRRIATQLGRTTESFSEAEKAIIRQNVVLSYGKRIAGAYEGAMTTAGKKLYSLIRYIDDFKVKFGTAFNPGFVILIDAFARALMEMQREIVKPEAQEALSNLSKLFAGMMVDLGKDLPSKIDSVTSSVQKIVDVYNSLPSGVVGAAGTGILLRMLGLPSQIVLLAASLHIMNSELEVTTKRLNEQVKAYNKEKYGYDEIKKRSKDSKKPTLEVVKERLELDKKLKNAIKLRNAAEKRWDFEAIARHNKRIKSYEEQIKAINEIFDPKPKTTVLDTITVTGRKIEPKDDWKAAKPISQGEWEKRFGFQAISAGEEKFLAFISTAEENQIRSIEKTRDGLITNINYYQDLGKIVQDITDIETAAKEKIAVVTQSGLDREKAANEAKAVKKAADHETVLQYISTESENEIRGLLATQDELLNKTEILLEQNAIRERTKELIDEVKEKELTSVEEWVGKSKDLMGSLKEVSQQAVVAFSSGMTDAFFEFAEGTKTAEEAFRQFASNFLKQIAKMIMQALILKAIQAGIGMIGGGGATTTTAGGMGSNYGSTFTTEGFLASGINAKGGVFSHGNKMMEYAKGGIVNSPTIFPMKNGAGLMGEAGPEAIMPLKRGKDGKLGVEGGGSNTINTTINVTTGGEGEDPEASKRRGNEMAKIIESEFNRNLTKQMRPGGILNSL